MIRTMLQLRQSEQPLRPATAVFLPSGDPTQWLQEITRWKISHAALRLYPLPAGRHSLAPQGVLVTSDAAVAWQDLDIHRGIPFGSASPRLYLPIDAALEPPLAAEELDKLLESERTYVWHPAIGLVAFEQSEVLQVVDLLEAPPPDTMAYDFAQPGVTFAKRLVGLTAEQTPDFILILTEGRDDIGAQANELLDLPPGPQEPSQSSLRRLSGRSLATLASIIRSLTEHAPATASAPTWINSLENWANQHLANFDQGLQAGRYKEISRLLHLLAEDPDQGLRYAIPLGAHGARGIAAPGSSLQEQRVDFDLRQLGGGKPVDFWGLPNDYLTSLQTRYRELANREMQLGRHRRAAYIFARLLGDDDAAANSLRAGRHFREAAVLYRDRLKRPLDAAVCLEQGGLLSEAAELLEQQQEHERLGDLLRRLQHNEAAEAAYRRAVKQHRVRGEFVQAAQLCEVKLAAPDEALAELQHGWLHSTQSTLCLQQIFRILGQHGRHAAARDWVERLRAGRYPAARAQAVAGLLADLAGAYPDASTQQQAADAARHVVARRLPTATSTELQPLLRALARLVPDDRLLARDCHRYQRQRALPAKLAMIPRPNGEIHCVRTVHLQATVAWQQAIVAEESIFAIGFEGQQLVLGRCDRDGENPQAVTLGTFEPRHTWSSILLNYSRAPRPSLLVHVVGGDPVAPRRVFLGAPEGGSQGVSAGGFRGISADVVAAARGTAGMTWVVEQRDQQFILIALLPSGELLSSHPLPLPHAQGTAPKLALHDDCLWIAAGDSLFTFRKNQLQLMLELQHPIESIVTPLPHTRSRVAATFPTGGLLIWSELSGTTTTPFARQLDAPLVGFNQRYLIAVNEACCEVYHSQAGRIELKARRETPQSRPVAVLPASPASHFMVLTEDGQINIYNVK